MTKGTLTDREVQETLQTDARVQKSEQDSEQTQARIANSGELVSDRQPNTPSTEAEAQNTTFGGSPARGTGGINRFT